MKTFLLSVLSLVFATIACADSPHFITADITLTPEGALHCAWKEAGLGNNELIEYACSADVVGAAWQCFNRGGNDPEPKFVVDRDVEAVGTFASGKNGHVVGSLTVPVPSLGDDFCPNRNWTLVLQGVRWCGTSLTDTTHGVVGADVPELFMGEPASVPDCESLLAQ